MMFDRLRQRFAKARGVELVPCCTGGGFSWERRVDEVHCPWCRPDSPKRAAWEANERERAEHERPARKVAEQQRAEDVWAAIVPNVVQRLADLIDVEREKRSGYSRIMSSHAAIESTMGREPRWERRLRALQREYPDDPAMVEETLYRELLEEWTKRERIEAEAARLRMQARQEGEATAPAPLEPAPDADPATRHAERSAAAAKYIRDNNLLPH